MIHCASCLDELTTQNAHPKSHRMCIPCWCKMMREKKEERDYERMNAERQLREWAFYNDHLADMNGNRRCPNFQACRNVLAPGMVWKHRPDLCKTCYQEEEIRKLGTRECELCHVQVPIAGFYPSNKKKCKKCLAKRDQAHKEWSKKMKASR